MRNRETLRQWWMVSSSAILPSSSSLGLSMKVMNVRKEETKEGNKQEAEIRVTARFGGEKQETNATICKSQCCQPIWLQLNYTRSNDNQISLRTSQPVCTASLYHMLQTWYSTWECQQPSCRCPSQCIGSPCTHPWRCLIIENNQRKRMQIECEEKVRGKNESMSTKNQLKIM